MIKYLFFVCFIYINIFELKQKTKNYHLYLDGGGGISSSSSRYLNLSISSSRCSLVTGLIIDSHTPVNARYSSYLACLRLYVITVGGSINRISNKLNKKFLDPYTAKANFHFQSSSLNRVKKVQKWRQEVTFVSIDTIKKQLS